MYTKARHSSMRTSFSSAGTLYPRNHACALSSPSPFHYVMAKIVPAMQLAAHTKSSSLYGRSYGRQSKYFRLDGSLLFPIIFNFNWCWHHALLLKNKTFPIFENLLKTSETTTKDRSRLKIPLTSTRVDHFASCDCIVARSQKPSIPSPHPPHPSVGILSVDSIPTVRFYVVS